jgi:hypothetical protein
MLREEIEAKWREEGMRLDMASARSKQLDVKHWGGWKLPAQDHTGFVSGTNGDGNWQMQGQGAREWGMDSVAWCGRRVKRLRVKDQCDWRLRLQGQSGLV